MHLSSRTLKSCPLSRTCGSQSTLQEHKQKAAVSSTGENAADLVSYVEFQRSYRCAIVI
jgi:hypothetical protein